MIEIKEKNKCCGCKACGNICPKKCIKFTEDIEGFSYPEVDEVLCINCHLCENVCPSLIQKTKRERKPLSYCAKIKDKEILDKSSSGGLFSTFANKILQDKGVVYGVAMMEDLKSAHTIRVEHKKDLTLLRGSKYIQSDTENIYIQVRRDLINGKKVLFSGVPCQMNALKMFLNKEYENLFCIEVVCHGTPSPALWKKYINYLENKYNAKVESVDFRNKKYKWKKFGIIENDKIVSQYLDQHTDPYMVMFLRDYCLRPSCYDCNAKKMESYADVTLADFWGIENVIPEMSDDTGASLVLIQTEKGKNLLLSIDEKINLKEVSYEKSIIYNPSYYKSVNKPQVRENFFEDMNKKDFTQLQTKYCNVINDRKFKSIIKRSVLYKLYNKIQKKGKKRLVYGLKIILNKK